MSKTATQIISMSGPVAAGSNGSPAVPTSLELSLERRQKKRRRTRTILFIAGGAVLVMIVIAIATGGKEKPISVQTEKVARHTITEVVQATGKIQPEVSVKVSPEVPGEIIALP